MIQNDWISMEIRESSKTADEYDGEVSRRPPVQIPG